MATFAFPDSDPIGKCAQDGKSIIPMMKKGEEPYFQRA